MKQMAWNIIASGLSKDTEVERLWRVIFLNALFTIGMFFTLSLGCLALSEGNNLLAIFDSLVFLILLRLCFYLRTTGNTSKTSKAAMATMSAFFLFLTVQGGADNTAILWTLVFPLLSVSLLGTKQGTVLSLLLLTGILFVFALEDTSIVTSHYSTAFQIRITAVYIISVILATLFEELRRRIHDNLRQSNQEKELAIEKLNKSIEEINTLQGIIPICLNCKRIRDDDGYWQAVEEYFVHKTEAQFSHALCPDCATKLYPEYTDHATSE